MPPLMLVLRMCVHLYIGAGKRVCVCQCRPLTPFVLKRMFCSGLTDELWVEGCLFNVTFTSHAVTQLAVYFRHL